VPIEHTGWLLDVYPDRDKGVVVWFVGEDGSRSRFTQNFGVTFYAGGDWQELRRLSAFLAKARLPHRSVKRNHLFHGPIDVIGIHVRQGSLQRSWFRKLHALFPDLDYYNADIALPIHFFAATETFALAYCKVWVDESNQIQKIENKDDKWSLQPKLPELRIMEIEPSSSPIKSLPSSLRVTFANVTDAIRLTSKPRIFLNQLAEKIELEDPDLIRTRYGDAWMFPYLFSVARANKLNFNPNRDKTRQPLRIEANQFESYGRLVHRDEQTHLFGRLHVDPQNSMAFKDWGPEGIYETARLSGLPIQNAARRSAGGAFVGMQINASLEKRILIPIRKEQRERFKSATRMLTADNGGVIFKPIVGLHSNVAEIDFFSMYPHIMTRWNISAETVGEDDETSRLAPGIEVPISQKQPGIVADILRPILDKRARAKKLIEDGIPIGYKENYVKIAYEFLKGLGWVSYGYQGFSGNRIGSIEAHEAINAISRDVILKAKEAAEDAGFEVLHIYVDSLFASIGPHKDRLPDLLEDIVSRTGLPVDNEGVLRWIAFLPSKQNQDVPVPNCFFGVFDKTGELKCRGIMARRGDTPAYIHDMQMEAIKLMAKEPEFPKLRSLIPKLVYFFKYHYHQVLENKVPALQMSIAQTLSRDLEDFKVISAAGSAALQMKEDGKSIGAGQEVEFIRVRDKPYSLSVHRIDPADPPALDADWYGEQILRAADEVLSPFGVPNEVLAGWLEGSGSYWSPEDFIAEIPLRWPILEHIRRVQKTNTTSWLVPRLLPASSK
jgi:DNA polymerase-2